MLMLYIYFLGFAVSCVISLDEFHISWYGGFQMCSTWKLHKDCGVQVSSMFMFFSYRNIEEYNFLHSLQ